MFYVYILRCSDDTLYTGYTNDLKERIKTHNLGKGAKYTRGRIPVKLEYYEEFENKSDALKRESKIKKYKRSKKINLIKKGKL
jgi:putative endonuclease